MRRRVTGQDGAFFPPPPGYRALTGAGVRGPVGDAPLSAGELDHCRRFGPRDRHGALAPITATKYTTKRWTFFDAERFRAVPVRRTIHPKGRRGRLTFS